MKTLWHEEVRLCGGIFNLGAISGSEILSSWYLILNDKPSCLGSNFSKKKLTYSQKSHVHLPHQEKIDNQQGAEFQHYRLWNCDQAA